MINHDDGSVTWTPQEVVEAGDWSIRMLAQAEILTDTLNETTAALNRTSDYVALQSRRMLLLARALELCSEVIDPQSDTAKMVVMLIKESREIQ